MVQIEYNTVKIEVPESWDDITLGFYETCTEYLTRFWRDGHKGRPIFATMDKELDGLFLNDWTEKLYEAVVDYPYSTHGNVYI